MSVSREFAASPREVMQALYRHKGKAVLTFLAVLGLTALGLAVWPAKYASDAKLFVRLGRESVSLDPTATTGQTISVSETREMEINSILDILGSRALSERILDTIPAEEILGRRYDTAEETKEKAIEKLGRSVSAFAAKKSNVINIHAEAGSPELAQNIAQTMLKAYLDQHVRMNHTAGSYEFFADQAQRAQNQLQKTTEELRDVKNAVGVVSVEGQRHLLMTQSSAVIGQLLSAESSLTAERTKAKELFAQVQKIPERVADDEVSGMPNVAGDSMKAKLYEVQLREKELAAKYTDAHPMLVGIREQVREAEKIVAAEPEARVQKTLRISRLRENLEFAMKSSEANIAGMQEQIKSLTGQRDQTLADLRKLNDNELNISRLQRESDLAEAKVKSYSEKLEQARINQALDAERISNVNVVQEASLTQKPVSPKAPLVAGAGLLLAICAGLGMALLAEYFDHSLRSVRETEAELDLPVLSTLPRVAPREAVLT